MNFVWFILIGIAAGWLAGQIMKGGGFGLLGDLIVGVIGALLGGFLFGLFGRMPKVGEQLRYKNLRLEVLDLEGRKISKIKVTKL